MAKQKKEIQDVKDYAVNFLKTNKDDHFNYIKEERNSHKISTGSLKFDHDIDGGIAPGVIGVTGPKESGKTSFILSCLKNTLDCVKGARGVFFAAERPLTREMQERCGVKFVRDPSEWEEGTCLLFECNIFETVLTFVTDLVKRSKDVDDEVFFFVIDSANALIKKEDREKGYDEAVKVAGGALLMSDFLKKVSMPIGLCGHYLFVTLQDRAEIKISQYVKGDRQNLRSSGGNAFPHYCLWIFDFQRTANSHLIINEGKTVGHDCFVKFEKTPNEMSNHMMSYPIKRGKTGGSSVWTDREIFDMLLLWEIINKSGSWMQFDEDFLDYMKNNGIDFPEKIQGQDKFTEFVEKSNALPIIESFIKQYE